MAKTKAKMQLIGIDGNAFNIMGKAVASMRKAGVDATTINSYSKEAMSGNYDNLLQVTMKYVNCDDDGSGDDYNTDCPENQ